MGLFSFKRFTIMVTKKEKQRLYRIHRNLARYGNLVDARKRMVTKRAETVSAKETAWIKELMKFDYCITNDMFGWE